MPTHEKINNTNCTALPKKRSEKLTPCMEESTEKVNVNFDVLKSTTIQIFCIRQILEKKWKHSGPVKFVIFVLIMAFFIFI